MSPLALPWPSVIVCLRPPWQRAAHCKHLNSASSSHETLTHLGVVLQVDDLVQGLVVQVVVVSLTGGRVEPQGLEHDAEEPGEEDVAWDQPGKLPPVLLAVTDPHPVKVNIISYSAQI